MPLPNGPYKPSEHESKILDEWIAAGAYKAEFDPSSDKVLDKHESKNDKRKPWALICPPPNAYGRPHIGNISGYAYMDAFARYHRMLGKKVLVLPGKDHAGLEGEGVFVREVLEKKKLSKFDMKREEFYQQMMQWMSENMSAAQKDEKEIGLSADFDRDTFTLDPDIVETVLDTFVEMYQKGMIYKGVRIVNWDPKARTAVADNQIEYQEAVTPFFYFKYAFTEPEDEAIRIRNKYKNETIVFSQINILPSVNLKDDKKRAAAKPVSYMDYAHQNFFRVVDEINVVPIGYDFGVSNELVNDIKGKAIGIEMRHDHKFRLVVANPDFEGDLKKEIWNVTSQSSKHIAGSHIILFDEYPEDKYYTNGFIIGTVRPETIFADTAIACNPKDKRYKAFVGKVVEVEFLGQRKKLHFIEDFKVDKEFGSGLLKVTPAHSAEDWEIAQRHPDECLPPIQVIGYDLKMNFLTGGYEGMKTKEARVKMREDMAEHGNLIYIDDNYENRVAIAERTKAPIEPLLSSQWYLRYDGIKEAAIKMVLNSHDDSTNLDISQEELDEKILQFSGEEVNRDLLAGKPEQSVTIHPASMVSKYNHWMNNLRDWAISRSLWWGYRLPVWYHGEIKEEIDEKGRVVEMIKLSDQQQSEMASWVELEYSNPNHILVQKDSPGKGWFQDESVLDTWFSSGQWPFATLMKYGLMDEFFPTDVLISGFDILENWDSRMMMFSFFKTGKVPFRDLYLTGLVKGTDGQKMSKSRGNVLSIDQLREKYGTDAVRMVYYYQNSAGADYAMTYEKLDTFKKYINKLWNASRFVLMNAEGISSLNEDEIGKDMSLDFSSKVLKHIKSVKDRITQNIEDFELGNATYTLYHEFWHEYCDLLIEESKQYILPVWNKETKKVEKEPDALEKSEVCSVMLYALKQYLKMLHPFMPFVTQRIWNEIPKHNSDHNFLMYCKW